MQLHDICLNCGHKRGEHSRDGSRCYKAYCLCMKYKDSLIRSQAG